MRRLLPYCLALFLAASGGSLAWAQSGNPRLMLLDAQAQAAQGQDERALALLDLAIESGGLSPNLQAIALSQRGKIHFRKKEFALAHADFGRALSIDPSLGQALRGDCFSLLNMRRFEAAQPVCEAAAAEAKAESAAEAADILGYAALVRRDYGTALAYFDQAIVADQSYAPAYLHRGLVYLAQKNETLARDDFLKARNLWPQDREIERTLRQLGVIF